MKKNNVMFFALFLGIIIIGCSTYFRNQKDISFFENRKLNKFPHLTIMNYLNGTFQDKIENAFADQFWGSSTIKKNYNNFLNFDDFFYKKFCKNNYYNIGGRSIFDCSDYIVFSPTYLDASSKKQTLKVLNSYIKLNNYIDTYYYFINTSVVFNFKENEYSINMEDIYKKYMDGNYKYSEFKFRNYDEFKKYFYKTDHHWNYNGSYLGYKDIMKMFDIDKVIEPVLKKKFDDYYYFGSHSSVTRKYDFFEEFEVYKFDYPRHITIINNKESCYGKQDEYFNGDRKYSKDVGLYGDFYGWDYGEVIFDFNNKDRDNLLIIGNSFTNSINILVASHFNKTFVVDLRNYEKDMNEKFDVLSYIKRNNINKVLVVSDYSFYTTDDFILDWRDS